MLVSTVPLAARAQGVPKAFESFDYSGTVNGKVVWFSLADGYIGASYVQMYKGKRRPDRIIGDSAADKSSSRSERSIKVREGRPRSAIAFSNSSTSCLPQVSGI